MENDRDTFYEQLCERGGFVETIILGRKVEAFINSDCDRSFIPIDIFPSVKKEGEPANSRVTDGEHEVNPTKKGWEAAQYTKVFFELGDGKHAFFPVLMFNRRGSRPVLGKDFLEGAKARWGLCDKEDHHDKLWRRHHCKRGSLFIKASETLVAIRVTLVSPRRSTIEKYDQSAACRSSSSKRKAKSACFHDALKISNPRLFCHGSAPRSRTFVNLEELPPKYSPTSGDS